MKLFAALITNISLASFGWAACPVATPSKVVAGQGPAPQDLRDTAFKNYREGRYQNAAACYAEAVQTAQTLGISNAAVANDLSNMGDLAEETGDYAGAKNYYLRGLDLLNNLGQAGSEAAGDFYTKLGILTQIQGLYSEAETNFKKAIALLTQHAGVENWRTAKALSCLGRLYVQMGKVTEASSLVRKAAAIAKRSLSEDDPLLMVFFDSEAYLLAQTGKYKEAEKTWMTALKIAEHAYGASGAEYSFLLLHLGQMYLLIGDYSAAQTMFRQGVAAEEKVTESDPMDRAIFLSSLAASYIKQRKVAEAEPLILESREVTKTNCGAAPIACALVRSHVGEYYATKGQWAMAEVEFEAALKLREDTLGTHPLVADSLISLARALRKVKRKGEAKIYEARATQILSSQQNPLYDRSNTIDVRAFQAANR